MLTAACRWRAIGPGRRLVGRLLRAARMLLAVLRGVPELVWALLFVRVFGLGPGGRVLALGITYGGMLGKGMGEIRSTDARPPAACSGPAAGGWRRWPTGCCPTRARSCCLHRIALGVCGAGLVVMGFVGPAASGSLMDQSMKMLNGGEAATILTTFLVLVLVADGVSEALRRRMA